MLSNFPFKLGGDVYAPPLLVSLDDDPDDCRPPLIVVAADDGHLYFIDVVGNCVDAIDVGGTGEKNIAMRADRFF